VDDFVRWGKEERREAFMRLPLSDAFFFAVRAMGSLTSSLIPYLDEDGPVRDAALDAIHALHKERQSRLLDMNNSQLFGVIQEYEEEARRIRDEGFTPPTASEGE
jgi:hypothetical protein